VRIVNTLGRGAADILARTVADHLSSVGGQQFLVETRAGAGGATSGLRRGESARPRLHRDHQCFAARACANQQSQARLGFAGAISTNIAYYRGVAGRVLRESRPAAVRTLAILSRALRQERQAAADLLVLRTSAEWASGRRNFFIFRQKAGIRIEQGAL